MSRIDRQSSLKGLSLERSGRSDFVRDTRASTQVALNPEVKKDTATSRTVQTFQGLSDFEPSGRTPPRGMPTVALTSPSAPTDAAALSGVDAELGLLLEFPDQPDSQGGLVSAMLHTHANDPSSQGRIVERLKQDGQLESLFGEVFREGNAHVDQPHRAAVVRALDIALSQGTVTQEDLRSFTQGAYAQEWQQIGSELNSRGTPPQQPQG